MTKLPQSFDEWLRSNNDALPEPTSFSEWLKSHHDSINLIGEGMVSKTEATHSVAFHGDRPRVEEE